MIQPQRAAVTPRVIWPETGDSVPIDEVFHRMAGKPAGAIEIVGKAGSGKTTALQHLAAEAPKDRQIVWADDAKPEEVTSRMRECWVVYTSTAHMAQVTASSFHLAGWGEDERIEYLLAKHPDKCQSVIVRLGAAPDRLEVGSSPMLWRIVLDEMANDESIRTLNDALRQRLTSGFPQGRGWGLRSLWRRMLGLTPRGHPRRLAEEYCFACQMGYKLRAERILKELLRYSNVKGLRLLRAVPVQTLMTAECVASRLMTPRGRFAAFSASSFGAPITRRSVPRRSKVSESSVLVLPYPVVVRAAALVANSPPALARLREILADDDPFPKPMAASVLHASGTGWLPERESRPCFNGAYLQNAVWPGIDLCEVHMIGADLSRSSLGRARLDRALAHGAVFCAASLPEASLVDIVATDSNFTNANLAGANLQGANLQDAGMSRAQLCQANLDKASLRGADLTGTSFVRASLRHATLFGATLAGTDFTSADLEGVDLHELDLRGAGLDDACLVSAALTQCNLEMMRLVRIDFSGAMLNRALLSGSIMQGGTLRLADLREAGLADVQWENADLRNTDLQGATFHLGTTRSGLVDSPLASEGTRTGFYTDEFNEQCYQTPEDIRKANLRGADLRGARVDGVDFYLVDLRDAKYDAKQLEHFRALPGDSQ